MCVWRERVVFVSIEINKGWGRERASVPLSVHSYGHMCGDMYAYSSRRWKRRRAAKTRQDSSVLRRRRVRAAVAVAREGGRARRRLFVACKRGAGCWVDGRIY